MVNNNSNVVNMQFYYISDNFIESDWTTWKQIIKSDFPNTLFELNDVKWKIHFDNLHVGTMCRHTDLSHNAVCLRERKKT